MVTRFISLILVTLSVCAAAQPTLPDRPFKYLIEALPKAGKSCAEEAARIQAQFREQTGNRLAVAQCKQETDTDFDIQVNYTGPTRINAVSTIEYVVGVAGSDQGTYDTADECNADLAGQIDLFKRETGLNPIVAYCYAESTEKKFAWALRIDAFGQPIHQAFVQGWELFGTPIEDPASLQARLLAYAKSKIAALGGIVVRPFTLDYEIRYLYYGEKMLPLQLATIGDFPDADQCARAQALAQTKIAAKSSSPLFCTDDNLLQSHSMQIFQLKSGSYLDLYPYPQTYDSFAACESDTDAALKQVAESTGASTAAAICHSSSSSAVAMTVLVQRGANAE